MSIPYQLDRMNQCFPTYNLLLTNICTKIFISKKKGTLRTYIFQSVILIYNYTQTHSDTKFLINSITFGISRENYSGSQDLLSQIVSIDNLSINHKEPLRTSVTRDLLLHADRFILVCQKSNRTRCPTRQTSSTMSSSYRKMDNFYLIRDAKSRRPIGKRSQKHSWNQYFDTLRGRGRH